MFLPATWVGKRSCKRGPFARGSWQTVDSLLLPTVATFGRYVGIQGPSKASEGRCKNQQAAMVSNIWRFFLSFLQAANDNPIGSTEPSKLNKNAGFFVTVARTVAQLRKTGDANQSARLNIFPLALNGYPRSCLHFSNNLGLFLSCSKAEATTSALGMSGSAATEKQVASLRRDITRPNL